MIKELITRLFNIETYESEYASVSKELASLKTEIDIKTGANDVLARKIVDLEDKVEALTQDPDKYIWQKISEYEKEYEDRIYNRGFNDGRMSAYGEVGIWNIDAHGRGNVLVRLSNDVDAEIVELLRGKLVDVVADDDVRSERVKRADVKSETADVISTTGWADYISTTGLADEIEIADLIGE